MEKEEEQGENYLGEEKKRENEYFGKLLNCKYMKTIKNKPYT